MARPVEAPKLIGRIVAGRYRIVQLLASGGIGHIYVAEPAGAPPGKADPRSRVAVKVLREELAGRSHIVARFHREATAAMRVRHDNILSIIAPPVEQGGLHYYVTELLVGLDLADTLAYTGTLGPARAVKIAGGVAEGLAAAHAVGVVHRDLKPENIFLVHSRDGSEAVKILDFGLAFMPGDEEATQARVIGTPGYMAPEQSRGALASPRADVYSLGVVLYEMLSGRVPPAPAGRRSQTPPLRPPDLDPAQHSSRPPPALPSPELDAVIQRALSPDPTARFASMLEFTFALLGVPEAG